MGVNESPTQTATEDVEDPVGYFLQDLVYHGKSERTRESYERVLRQFEAFLDNGDRNPMGTSIPPGQATQRECMAWVHTLRGNVATSTVATYASYLHRFYSYMTQVGVFESNPMTLVMEEMDESIDKNPTRRDISIVQMRRFLDDVTHPLERVVFVALLKTGMRVGELCNLDLQDVNLADVSERFGGETSPVDHHVSLRLGGRPQIDGRPDSIYVGAEPSRGQQTNGETREASNKRKRPTVVPVDNELKQTLVRWLAIRPDARSPADPLFVSTSGDWGKRLTPKMVRNVVEKRARAAGWYRTGGGAEENVTPHYFRHFFTTHLRDRTGDRGIVKYLRGDVAEDIIDTYTHNWGGRVREVYDANIYSLL